MRAQAQEVGRGYAERGFTRLPGLFGPGEVTEIRGHIDRLAADAVAVMEAGDYVLEADGTSARNMWRLQDYDPFFAELASRPEVLARVAGLLGDDDPVLLAVETFNKPARHGSAVPAHQDNAYFCLEPPEALTVWVAVDAVTDANGPVSYLPGSHRELLPHTASGIPGNSMKLTDPPAGPQAAAAEQGLLAPGDAMAHHSQTIHWSHANLSDAPRCGMLLVYRAHRALPAPGLREAYRAAQAEFATRQTAGGAG